MPAEKSAGAIIFRREKSKIFYLLLHYEEGHWGSPKGHIESGETIEETARREIREETGLTDIRLVDGFQELNRYIYMSQGQRMFKTVVFLLAETQIAEVKISWEHIGFSWLIYDEALEKITFKSEKIVLQKAANFISAR
jgi:bis(5'-nucleosidyl)-tetraphosphatase